MVRIAFTSWRRVGQMAGIGEAVQKLMQPWWEFVGPRIPKSKTLWRYSILLLLLSFGIVSCISGDPGRYTVHNVSDETVCIHVDVLDLNDIQYVPKDVPPTPKTDPCIRSGDYGATGPVYFSYVDKTRIRMTARFQSSGRNVSETFDATELAVPAQRLVIGSSGFEFENFQP